MLLRSLSKWLLNTFALVEFHVTSNYAVIYLDPAARSLPPVTFWILGQLLAQCRSTDMYNQVQETFTADPALLSR